MSEYDDADAMSDTTSGGEIEAVSDYNYLVVQGRSDESYTDAELHKMLDNRWDGDVQRKGPFVISTRGKRGWIYQNMDITTSSIVKLSGATGDMDCGPVYKGRRVDCRGYFNGAVLDGIANHDCMVPGMNKLCMLVGIGQAGKLVLNNAGIGPAGASVDFSWPVGQHDIGKVYTSFNDSDSNNDGYLTQEINAYSPAEFARELIEKRKGGKPVS